MSSQLTPRRLQKRVDEWREARMKKWADRLQMHADKSRTVSALVLGIKETKSVQLPTPPSTKSNESRSRLSCVNNKMTKAYSSGDVHNYHQQRYSNYLHDYRNGGMCREGPRSPYGHPQGQAHHPRSPHPSGFRGSILPNSEPRKSFGPSAAYRNYTRSTGTENHQQPSTSTYHCKGIRKDANRPQQDKSIRKSLAPKEKTVTFEDEVGNVEPSTSRSIEVPAAAAGVSVELHLSGGEDSPLNSTFTLDDGNSLNPTSNSVDAVENNLSVAGYTQEADIPSTSQECTVLEKPNEQNVTISTDLRIISDNTEVQGDSGHETKECAPIIILTEPEYQEKEQGNKNMEAQYETQIKVTGDKDDLVDNEAEVAQLDEELCKEVEAITSDLSESDASSFSLCLEANSSPLAEVVIEPCQVEPVKDYHEAVGSEDCANDSVFYLAEGAEEVIQPEPASDPLAMEEQGPSTLEPKTVGLKESPTQDKSSHKENTIDVITENLDVLYITPARKGRKSRALLDTTNIVESSSIKYVVREVKQKEMLDADIVITPVRRSTRKKVETPGTLQSGQFVEVLSPQVLRKAKIVPNNFLPT